MKQAVTLFVGMFTTLLAIINPLEALPVFLNLLQGKDEKERLLVARRSCVYAMLLMFFFLLFGTLLLRIFGVPLSMVRIVGGVILMRIGFDLFSSPSSGASMTGAARGSTHCSPLLPPLRPLWLRCSSRTCSLSIPSRSWERSAPGVSTQPLALSVFSSLRLAWG